MIYKFMTSDFTLPLLDSTESRPRL